MVERLTLVDATLAERVAAASDADRRTVTLAVVRAALDRIGFSDARVDDAVGALEAGRYGDGSEQGALAALVEELDNAAFDAQDRLDEGTGSEADYDVAFRKARAATAVLSAFQTDSLTAVSDAVYEAYHAVDEDRQFIAEAVRSA